MSAMLEPVFNQTYLRQKSLCACAMIGVFIERWAVRSSQVLVYVINFCWISISFFFYLSSSGTICTVKQLCGPGSFGHGDSVEMFWECPHTVSWEVEGWKPYLKPIPHKALSCGSNWVQLSRGIIENPNPNLRRVCVCGLTNTQHVWQDNDKLTVEETGRHSDWMSTINVALAETNTVPSLRWYDTNQISCQFVLDCC